MQAYEEANSTTKHHRSIDFTVMILTAGSWPINGPTNHLLLPFNISPLSKEYQSWYTERYSSRKLTWLWNHSRAELRMNCRTGRYHLFTDTYQMSVLLRYNDREKLSSTELESLTLLPKHILINVLESLVEAGILVRGQSNIYEFNDCKLASSFGWCNKLTIISTKLLCQTRSGCM